MDPEVIKTEDLNLSYSDATVEDVPGIIAVQQETWIATYTNVELNITQEAVAERVAGFNSQERIDRYKDTIKNNPNMHTWVAKNGEKIIGFCTAEKQEGKGEVKAIYVLPKYQGHKIGKVLMETALSWLGEQEVILEVADYNANAMDFYRRFGFVEYAKGPKEIEFSSGGKITTKLMRKPS